MNRKSLGAVVATALLIVVSVLAVIGFQTWFQTYSSSIFTSAENNNILSVNFEKEVVDTLYLKSNKISSFDYLSISSIDGTKTCEISKDSINNLNSSTVLLLDMDHKNSTHIFDLSGYGNDCRIVGPICNVSGLNGEGCFFDGNNDHLDCGNDESLNFNSSFSVILWFKPYDWNNDLTGGKILINKFKWDSIYSKGFYIGRGWNPVDYISINVNINTNSQKVYTIENVSNNLNNWNLVSTVFDSNEIFKFGLNRNTYNYTYNMFNTFTAAESVNLTIGRRSDGSQGPYYGLIDGVLLTRDVLTNDEINYLYENKKAIKYEQLITKGISSIDLSSCNLNKGEQYNLLILGDNVNIQQTFIAQ